jgi:K+-transporting ATPase ATPase C chain
MVLSSASGLDPDISVDNAKIQALRIAKARKITVGSVLSIIQAKKESPFLGFWETEKVNVLKLNMALDQLKKE